MGLLINIANKMKGKPHCERLVKLVGNEITITGAKFGFGNLTIDIGSYSNKIKEFYQVPGAMVSLDNSQYLLCETISQMKPEEPLREDCQRIRLQLILAFNQLQGMLSIPNPTDDTNKEITKWVKYMNKLNKECITILGPGPKKVSKGGTSPIREVTKYQGIDEGEMQEALRILR